MIADDALLRDLTPRVIAILVRRGADFAAAEDAVQEALVQAVRTWPADPPTRSSGEVSRVTRPLRTSGSNALAASASSTRPAMASQG